MKDNTFKAERVCAGSQPVHGQAHPNVGQQGSPCLTLRGVEHIPNPCGPRRVEDVPWHPGKSIGGALEKASSCFGSRRQGRSSARRGGSSPRPGSAQGLPKAPRRLVLGGASPSGACPCRVSNAQATLERHGSPPTLEPSNVRARRVEARACDGASFRMWQGRGSTRGFGLGPRLRSATPSSAYATANQSTPWASRRRPNITGSVP